MSLSANSKLLCWWWSRRPDKSPLNNERFVLAVRKICVGGAKGLCWRYEKFVLAVRKVCGGGGLGDRTSRPWTTKGLCGRYERFVLAVILETGQVTPEQPKVYAGGRDCTNHP